MYVAWTPIIGNVTSSHVEHGEAILFVLVSRPPCTRRYGRNDVKDDIDARLMIIPLLDVYS